MTNLKYFLPLALLCSFVALPARANDLTLYGGAQNPGSLTLHSATGSILSTNPASFGTFGLRAAFGRVIGSETTLGYSPNFISTQHSAIIFNSNFMVQAPLPIVRPYATVGLGTVYVRGNSGFQAVTGSKFALNYGGGLKIKLAGPVGIQLDARGYSLFGVDSQTLKVLETSIGLVFSF